ncbi:hypothetical protein C2G38_2177846 [Gigaspora rosea]|uniref:C2H2-type domain-containing protein n=1 Tax=Gigaspora rosea TaxID=44941 RepID=A0A397VG87_9GLOM|nr:hypothetical protein C2G38_2177846 [Gigaspora rosea]
MPPRRKHLGGDKLVKTTGKKFKCPNCSSNFNSHTEVVNHVKEIHQTTRVEHLLLKVDSRQIKSCRELDRLINELTRAEEKYLPLIEHGYPVKQVFDQSRQSIWQLKENFKTFTQRQFSLNKPILHKRALAEKEKVAEKGVIASLTERHKKLPDTHESLLKNHATLKKDYDALLENNSVERCRLLEQENCVLINRNLELFEEIEELRKEIETLKKRNESLSCVIVIDDFNFQSYCSEEKLAAILCEIEVYMGFPDPYEFKLFLRGTRDGFTADSFWKLCDKQTQIVVVMKVKVLTKFLEVIILSVGINQLIVIIEVANGYGPIFGAGYNLVMSNGLFNQDRKCWHEQKSFEKRIRNASTFESDGFSYISIEEYRIFQNNKKIQEF